ncbi:MAG: hypothetical protein U0165_11320 [Polyangiaceae bacterium]
MVTPEEPLYTLPTSQFTTPPLVAAKGSVLFTTWKLYRERGWFSRYVDALPRQYRDNVMSTSVADWVPLPHLQAHYDACEALNLSIDEQIEVGRVVADAVHGAFLNTLSKMAGKLGISPWIPLAQCNKLWQRSWQGGAMMVYRCGERSARLELWSVAVAQSSFHRVSMRGATLAGVEPFCGHLDIFEIPEKRTHNSYALKLVW